MRMSSLIITYAIAFALLLAIDLVWLGVIAKSTYMAEMGQLLRPQPQLVPAALFYLIFAAGLVLFAIAPAQAKGSLMLAVGLGAALGFVSYSTYNLTNLSILQGYPARIAVMDLAWGTVLSGAVSGLTVWLARMLG
jgi:uncharacterized membrane protein